MSDDADRVAELEERIDELEERLEERERDFAMMATELDLEEVPAPTCPECGEGTLSKRSGFSWSQAVCSSCERAWYLTR